MTHQIVLRYLAIKLNVSSANRKFKIVIKGNIFYNKLYVAIKIGLYHSLSKEKPWALMSYYC
jgi:hypothetical protein